ncbi:39S ribosomal protein L41, mitochondrial [Athalia rosae]|uniref:39S ribosomal protein L41, mitochondrial n=1 Tax=Athalia rosae TaxID=37344 RepID=UPI0020333C90|nr:39S ribosomal protein L41, mitochondrial [Athalia rosae]XP_012267055.2 39S ribosomal protein L41, mitochondrial [Athalia rosae]XP_020711754.2 39S ribosomal protein L41, mitochondrial [Athalia rosae]
MSSACTILRRSISTTCVCHGKRNFRKFLLYNKRGTRLFKEHQRTALNPVIPIDHRGVRPVGYHHDNEFITIPEMVPDIIVPSLEGFNLKPYVAYHTVNVEQSEFTPQDLFDAVYAPKIHDDFQKKKLAEDGSPLDPNEHEKLTAEDAKRLASKTGSDLFG